MNPFACSARFGVHLIRPAATFPFDAEKENIFASLPRAGSLPPSILVPPPSNFGETSRRDEANLG